MFSGPGDTARFRDQRDLGYAEGYNKGKTDGSQDADGEFTVTITPTVRNLSWDLRFIKTRKYQYGYRYQLHVKGIPCLQPHDVITAEKTEVFADHEKLGEIALALAKEQLPFDPSKLKHIRFTKWVSAKGKRRFK